MKLINLIDKCLNFVVLCSKKYNIDESHALLHSIEVLHYAKKILHSELEANPYLHEQKDIIYTSAILHDMCDNKYVVEKEGLHRIDQFLSPHMEPEKIHTVLEIISKMSYSKVKKVGFPNLGDHQLAYHIVRESDLLTAYHIPRSIAFTMIKLDKTYSNGLDDIRLLFEQRMLHQIKDSLFVTKYSQQQAFKLHNETLRSLDDYTCKF